MPRLFILPLALTLWPLGLHAGETGYPLRPGDVVAISLYEREDLSGEFTVRDDGRISLHVLGPVEAEGMQVAELEEELEARIGELLGGGGSVTVEVVSYGDYYVLGDVTAPGSYTFRPGITVTQAVARAGGYLRLLDPSDDQTTLRLMQELGRVASLEARLAEILAIRARIEAEAAGRDDIDFPEEFAALARGTAETMMAEQRHLLELRRANLEQRVAASLQRSEVAAVEVESLQGQAEAIEQMAASTSEQLESLEDLFERGLAQIDRLQRVRSDAYTFRSEAMSVTAFLARAEQAVITAQAEAQALRDQRAEEVASELAAITAEENTARAEIDAARRMIGSLGGLSAAPPSADEVSTVFEITREDTQGGSEAISADGQTRLRPGDVLDVHRSIPMGTLSVAR